MEKIEVSRHIPFGISLQEVLKHPSLSDTKLKRLLRIRGIYVEDVKSLNTYPLLLSTLLSPCEFEYIKSTIREKESIPKITSRPLAWGNNEDLIKIIPDKIDLKKIISEAETKCTVVSQTNFAMVNNDPNKVVMKFRCQTNNYNSGWYRTKNEYDGEIILEKVVNRGKIYLRMIHSSPETSFIADLGVKYLVNEFKNKGYTKKDAELERILYKDFSNEERIKYFLSLTDNSSVFQFQRATYFDISPDDTLTMPTEIARFMTGKVNVITLDGDMLHQHFLIGEADNHKYMELANIEALYNFSYHGAEGNCRVHFGFAGYFKKRLSNTEFTIDISKLNLKPEFNHVNRDKVLLHLLQEFDNFKMDKYHLLKTEL